MLVLNIKSVKFDSVVCEVSILVLMDVGLKQNLSAGDFVNVFKFQSLF